MPIRNGKMARIVIEVPEEVAALLKKEPLLRHAISEIVKKQIIEYILTITALDKLTEKSKLTEEDVMRLSKLINRAVREKWDVESSS